MLGSFKLLLKCKYFKKNFKNMLSFETNFFKNNLKIILKNYWFLITCISEPCEKTLWCHNKNRKKKDLLVVTFKHE